MRKDFKHKNSPFSKSNLICNILYFFIFPIQSLKKNARMNSQPKYILSIKCKLISMFYESKTHRYDNDVNENKHRYLVRLR